MASLDNKREFVRKQSRQQKRFSKGTQLENLTQGTNPGRAKSNLQQATNGNISQEAFVKLTSAERKQKELGLSDEEFAKIKSNLTFEGQRTKVSPEAHKQVQEAIKNNATSDQIRAILESNRLAPSTVAPQLTEEQEAERLQRQEQLNLSEEQSTGLFGKGAEALGFEKEEGKGILGGDFATPHNLGQAVKVGALSAIAIVGAEYLAGRYLVGRSATSAAGRSIGKYTAGEIKDLTSYHAKKAVSYMAKNIKSAGVAGVIGNAIFNGFLDEEAIQNLDFAFSAAIKNKNFEQAQSLLDQKKELTDDGTLYLVKLLVPGKGIYDYLKAAQSSRKVQEETINRELRKSEKQQETLNHSQPKPSLSPSKP